MLDPTLLARKFSIHVRAFNLRKLFVYAKMEKYEVTRTEVLCRRILAECLKKDVDDIVVHNSLKELEMIENAKQL